MIKSVFVYFFIFISHLTIMAQSVYVDSNIGNDNNTGTKESPVFSINKAAEIVDNTGNDFYKIKINPGIYILNKHVEVATKKTMLNKRIVIEASILPDNSIWTPEKMPIIISRSNAGEIMADDDFLRDNWITCFYINESHVTIRGLKFLGYNYPTKIFYPITRFNKLKTDLLIEQCMFLGDLQTASIQVCIIAHGDSVKVDHCVFYNANNSVVYWHDSGNGYKTGNSMTNCIIYGASESAVYTCYADNDFLFKNNIVSNCKIFWSKCPQFNNAAYSLDSCIVVNCKIHKGNGADSLAFTLNETNVIKEGRISLRMINTIWEPFPNDHLHIIPGTLGYNLGAGLFKYKKQ